MARDAPPRAHRAAPTLLSETTESTRAEVQHKLDPRFAELEARFAAQPWVAGDCSVADA